MNNTVEIETEINLLQKEKLIWLNAINLKKRLP